MATGPGFQQARAPRVAAVVPVFRPDLDLVEAVAGTRDQVTAVVLVCDEAPAGARTETVLEACRDLGATVLRHDRNRGIAAALNTGIAHLRRTLLDAGDLVLTLDQDSVLPRGYVARLTQALHAPGAGGRPRPGLAAPARVEGVTGRHGAREPIQSGLLVRRSVLDDLGGFDEGLFIDGVDTDFVLRARARGWSCVLVPGVGLRHRLGRRVHVRWGRVEVPVTVAADTRYYYLARNLLLLLRRHARREPAWAVRSVAVLVRHLLLTGVLVPGRRRRWLWLAAGLRDGVRGVRGPAPERWSAQVPSDPSR